VLQGLGKFSLHAQVLRRYLQVYEPLLKSSLTEWVQHTPFFELLRFEGSPLQLAGHTGRSEWSVQAELSALFEWFEVFGLVGQLMSGN
jgi:hypothetical protein